MAVQGANFTGTVRVLFGAAPAASVHVVSATSLVAVSPQHVPGTVHVRVVTDCCASPARNADKFTFVGPAVDSIAPTTGPKAGGTVVTITGSGFTADSTVTFAGHPAAAVTFVSPTQLNATSPPHKPGDRARPGQHAAGAVGPRRRRPVHLHPVVSAFTAAG